MDVELYFLVVVLFGLIGPSICEYCTERYHSPGFGYTTRTIHCSFGCCGSYNDQYCCVSSTGFIVGIIFAVIFIISITVAVICCCIKHKGSRGRVVQPSTITTNLAAPNHSTTHSSHVFIVPTAPTQPAYMSGYPTDVNSQFHPLPPYYQPQGGYASTMPPAYSTVAPPPAYSANAPPTQYPPHTYQQQQPNPFAAAAERSGTAS